MKDPRALCRPRFSFFNIQFSKNRLRKRDVVGLSAFGFGPGRVSLTRLSGIRFTRANSLVASGAPPSLWGVYSRRPFEVSTAISKFFRFFVTEFSAGFSSGRPAPAATLRTGGLRHGEALFPPHCGQRQEANGRMCESRLIRVREGRGEIGLRRAASFDFAVRDRQMSDQEAGRQTPPPGKSRLTGCRTSTKP